MTKLFMLQNSVQINNNKIVSESITTLLVETDIGHGLVKYRDMCKTHSIYGSANQCNVCKQTVLMISYVI